MVPHWWASETAKGILNYSVGWEAELGGMTSLAAVLCKHGIGMANV